MNKDDIHLLYEYDRWANNRALQAASALTAEQFTRDLGGAFHSLRDTLVHIVAGEWAWLNIGTSPLPATPSTQIWTSAWPLRSIPMRFPTSQQCSRSGPKSRKHKSSS